MTFEPVVTEVLPITPDLPQQGKPQVHPRAIDDSLKKYLSRKFTNDKTTYSSEKRANRHMKRKTKDFERTSRGIPFVIKNIHLKPTLR